MTVEPLLLDFGKYNGTPLTRVPVGYLRWMVNQHEMMPLWRELAGAELNRRGTTVQEVEVTAHAVDRASMRAIDIWRKNAKLNEGLYSFLARITLDALKHGLYNDDGSRTYLGLRLFIVEGVEYPVLKSVVVEVVPV